MRNKVLATLHAALIFCGAAPAAAQELDQHEELERVRGSLERVVAENTTNAELYDTNGFRVESSVNAQLGADFKPDGTRFEGLNISADGVFRVAIEKGRPQSAGGGLAIFHRDSGRPILSVGDSDGDGALDALSYAKVDEDGKAILEVIDYQADGQPDMRIHFVDHYSELWHADRWYRVETRGDRRGIVMDNVFVELKRENNRLVVP
jgi:hypothetical protein